VVLQLRPPPFAQVIYEVGVGLNDVRYLPGRVAFSDILHPASQRVNATHDILGVSTRIKHFNRAAQPLKLKLQGCVIFAIGLPNDFFRLLLLALALLVFLPFVLLIFVLLSLFFLAFVFLPLEGFGLFDSPLFQVLVPVA
jgi:hypothetical protein